MTRVRFAPSPTGYLHIGGARTFIFNWLHARHLGGVVVLRIDDTDVERNTQTSLDSIYEGLQWLELGWDEFYRQSDRLDLHRRAAWAIFGKGGGQLSSELSGTVVSFNGFAAPLLYASVTQIAAIVPYAVSGSSGDQALVLSQESAQ